MLPDGAHDDVMHSSEDEWRHAEVRVVYDIIQYRYVKLFENIHNF